MSKSWKKITPVNNVNFSFSEVMSEQMAVKLQLEEDIRLANDEQEAKRLSLLLNEEPETTADDFELAKKMQEQFDREQLGYAESLKAAGLVEPLNVELENANLPDDDPVVEPCSSDDSESEEFRREWDAFEKTEKQQATMSKYMKHDLNVSSRMNACKLVNNALHMNISTGDVGNPSHDVKLNNAVYNSLKGHVKKERKRFARLNDRCAKSTAEGVMDEQSKLVLFKLINANILEEVNGIISTGKESNVYHGIGSNFEKRIDLGEVAIKIFKTRINEFKNRSSYVVGDYRFGDRITKSNSHKNIQTWAEKELANLERIRKVGILCPYTVMLKKHILVMEFLGADGVASPTLREATHLNSTQLQRAKNQTLDIIREMYEKCDLIHADLSEYNLIWHGGSVYVIDLGQSVLRGHPFAFKFLLRDCENISKFFLSRGVSEMMSGPELFCEITGIDKNLVNCADDAEVLQKIRDIENDNHFFSKHMNDKKKDDLFDEVFERSLTEPNDNKMSKMSIKNSCV